MQHKRASADAKEIEVALVAHEKCAGSQLEGKSFKYVATARRTKISK